MSMNKTLEERFRHHFRFFDTDNDGFLTEKDVDMQIENTKLLYESGDEEAAKLRQISTDWWKTFTKFAVDGRLTEDSYVESLNSLFGGTFHEDLKKRFLVVFDLMDRNHDEKLSLREFLIFFKLFNVTNLDEVKKIFRRLDVQDKGYVTREEWVSANVNYFTRDDPEEDFGFLYRNLKK